jgi:hypothetical protein
VGKVENSRLGVLRMIVTFAVGGDAFADKINAFNRTMNLGHRQWLWFAEFRSTQCRDGTRCDLSGPDEVRTHVAQNAALSGAGPAGRNEGARRGQRWLKPPGIHRRRRHTLPRAGDSAGD